MSIRHLPMLVCTLFMFCVLPSAAVAADRCEDPHPLRFALIPKKSMAQQLDSYRSLIRRLEQVLEREVEIVHPASYSAVIEGLLSGGIDVAELGAASYSLAKKRDPAAITAFASHAHAGGQYTREGPFYHSLLIVDSRSRYHDVQALQGKNVSLTDPASTSGSVVPRKIFAAEIGQPLQGYFAHITYAGSHERAAQAVLKGYADAAFVASTRLDEALAAGMFKPDDFRVLWRSDVIPNEPAVYRTQLCPEVKAKISSVYLGDQEQLAPVLRKLQAMKFIPVRDEDYRLIRELVD